MKKQIIAQLQQLDFLRDHATHFTEDQAREVIKIVFPNRLSRVYRNTWSSYGLKHLLEKISRYVAGSEVGKYCSNTTCKEAMIKEGFLYEKVDKNGLNLRFNVSSLDLRFIQELINQQK